MTEINRNLKNVKASALLAVTGYEPSPARTIACMKDCLANGYPILARLHSGADYPTGNERDDKKLDMESHAVLIVGYDEPKRIFFVSDPWSGESRSDLSGVRPMTYGAVCGLMVNATRGKITILGAPDARLNCTERDGACYLELTYGFYRPRGYVIDEETTAFTCVHATVAIDSSKYEASEDGYWHVGQHAHLRFPLDARISGERKVQISVESTLTGVRPYPYEDKYCIAFEESVEFDSAQIISESYQIPLAISKVA